MIFTVLFSALVLEHQARPIPEYIQDNILWVSEIFPSDAAEIALGKLKDNAKNKSEAFDNPLYQTRKGISTVTSVGLAVPN